jgi:hypothetical protein
MLPQHSRSQTRVKEECCDILSSQPKNLAIHTYEDETWNIFVGM